MSDCIVCPRSSSKQSCFAQLKPVLEVFFPIPCLHSIFHSPEIRAKPDPIETSLAPHSRHDTTRNSPLPGEAIVCEEVEQPKSWCLEGEGGCKVGREVDSPDMLECPFCFEYFHPVCVGVPVPDAAEYAEVWACESCHKLPRMPPHPSTWYGVQKCDRDNKNVHKGPKCETCAAYNANASPEAFRKAVDGRRRYLPKTVKELKKAGETYKRKWFKPIKEEGYAASQSEHSSPAAKLTSSYLHPQVRRDGLVRRGG